MRRQHGFNLVELLIAVAIIGILGSIGYSSYVGYMVDSRRAEATGRLLQLAQTQEKYYAENDQYAPSVADLGVAATTVNGYYDLSISTSDSSNQDFSISASPPSDGIQASDTECATITISSIGSRSPADCWK